MSRLGILQKTEERENQEMSLNHFLQPKKKTLSLKAAIKKMRSLWFEGEVNRFDLKLSRVLDCSLEHAEIIRGFWVKADFLGFNKRGLLCWKTGGT